MSCAPRAVSTREAQNKLSALIGWAREHGDAVIVENRGEPAAVIIPYTEYERLRAMEERQRRQDVWERLRRLQAEVGARNADLGEEQIEALADEVTRDAVGGLVETGKVRFAP